MPLVTSIDMVLMDYPTKLWQNPALMGISVNLFTFSMAEDMFPIFGNKVWGKL